MRVRKCFFRLNARKNVEWVLLLTYDSRVGKGEKEDFRDSCFLSSFESLLIGKHSMLVIEYSEREIQEERGR